MRLWRNTIILFHDRRKPPFRGPFKEAGYQSFVIEPYLGIDDEDENNPDVVAAKTPEWMIMELTFNANESKECQLEKYSKVDPRTLSTYGLRGEGEPSVICSRFSEVSSEIDDGEFCQIFVKGRFAVAGTEYLEDDELREVLKESTGLQFKCIHDLSISFVPESRLQEIKRGLFPHIMKLFRPDSNGMTADDIVESGLDVIADKVAEKPKRELIEKVNVALYECERKVLSEYLKCEDGVYKSRLDEGADHYATRNKITQKLQSWAGVAKTTLDDF